MSDHHHHHEPGSAVVSRKLIIASTATAVFVAVEVTVGIRANSLALIGDALHNVTDTLALLLALFAVRVERRPATSAKSYGWHRAGVLAAFINAGALAAFTIFLFVEAAERLRAPASVNSKAMLITAAAALVLNGSITLWLRSHGRHDLNIRGAVLHMLGDALSSVGIMGAAILIAVTGRQFWDPAVSIAIGVLILWSSWGILREAINLLLEGTPAGIDPDDVTRAIAALEGVDGVHHLHIWALGPSRPALSCHLMVGDIPVRSTGNVLAQVNELLAHEYGIAHTTIQFEFANCDTDDPYCVPYGEA
ncbi:MAG TPA: cation diffusion facilitator family transporter [Thermoanaerobaculia bacterium]|jgi:cobalt-zinc-cadmium efflux system protein|nr:cation diffusion facilitator family transporter [Thermoanaerobaculia bacterium]